MNRAQRRAQRCRWSRCKSKPQIALRHNEIEIGTFCPPHANFMMASLCRQQAEMIGPIAKAGYDAWRGEVEEREGITLPDVWGADFA